AAFHEAHRTRFGHADPSRPVEVVNVRIVGTALGATAERRNGGKRSGGAGGLEPGTRFDGPVTVPLEDATVRIEAGWTGAVHESGAIIVEQR
ncbi:MAG: hypothetical protein OEW06_09340, partial [Gemmatimonadota bacterium]|nr:hypothetical protein [Gemmatimonadota bacterium]